MPTLFKLTPLGKVVVDIDPELLQQALPKDMCIESREDGTYVLVDSVEPEDRSAQYRIERELDRLFFLTNVRIQATMCTATGVATLPLCINVQGKLPHNIAPLVWSYDLALQLRLWRIAVQHDDPVLKVLLLFQIIEITYPSKSDYPPYSDAKLPPHPLTECKLLRNLIAHSGQVGATDLKNYCAYLGLPALMLDRTDPYYVTLLSNKVSIVEREAKNVLVGALLQSN